ncbi:MAG: ABC transporter ATP-binding protein [Desulfotomaculales bacterium]
MTQEIISTQGLSMAFGGHQVLSGITAGVAAGSFTSLIGPNGAGKTTFFNLLSGQLVPTGGKIFFRGREITGLPAHARARLGLGRCFQITNVFPGLTALENVRLAVQARERVGYRPFTPVHRFPALKEKALALLELVELTKKADFPAAALTHGEKRKLEIAIVLAMEPEVLLLDEPTAGVSLEEVPAMLSLLQSLKEKRNRTILLVEHKMDMVLSLSDEMIVLHNGVLLARGAPEKIVADERVQAAYLGGGLL